MIEWAIAILQQAGFDLTAQELAEIIWLAVHIEPDRTQPQSAESKALTKANLPQARETPSPSPQSPELHAEVYLPSASPTAKTKDTSESIPIKVPAAVALRNSLALGRSLRPLMRKVPSLDEQILDEEATVCRIAEEKIRIPVLKPAPQRWLELALVVEQSRSTAVWRQTIIELQKLLERHGAFRSVRTWELRITREAREGIKIKKQLFERDSTGNYGSRPHSPKELIDPNGQRLVLLVSDCISPAWRERHIHSLLELWGRNGLMAILQLLPERLWERTALTSEIPVQLYSLKPGAFNSQLVVESEYKSEYENEPTIHNSIFVPVVTLDPAPLIAWSQVIAGQGNGRTAGFRFNSYSPAPSESEEQSIPREADLAASDLVSRFRATASPLARRLARFMASAPVSLPVVRLIQQTLLSQSGQLHVAEVFMSGLLMRSALGSSASLSPHQDRNPDIVEYEFIAGIRELLRDSMPISKTNSVIEKVSEFIAKRLGLSVREFEARLLTPTFQAEDNVEAKIRSFAQLKAEVLRQLGGSYVYLAAQLEAVNKASEAIQTLSESLGNARITQSEKFEVITVNARGQEIKREASQSLYYLEDLGGNIELEMVVVPGGKFLMGSPQEVGYDDERPQHEVTVRSFFIGKYAVTQAQWKVVAALPKIERDLDPDPSHFKGDDRPVESVSWDDAVEFCARLSRKTGREYRLPSEAEWEYACRAGTTTPFHFGETITTDLANYRGTDRTYEDKLYKGTYGDGPEGMYRQQTTPVGSFPPNALGLYDMHGNVWEWCADTWRENYEGAPTDSSAWIENDNNSQRLLRGGSWFVNPGCCRSAYRVRSTPDLRDDNVGFRLACGAVARTY